MKLFGFEIRKATKEEISNASAVGGWSYSARHLQSRAKPLLLPAVYRCVELISDSVAVLPIKIYPFFTRKANFRIPMAVPIFEF